MLETLRSKRMLMLVPALSLVIMTELKKNKTLIKKGSFIGSNSSLVASVIVGKNSIIGAGSVITKDVPDNTLALTRAKQKKVKLNKKKK